MQPLKKFPPGYPAKAPLGQSMLAPRGFTLSDVTGLDGHRQIESQVEGQQHQQYSPGAPMVESSVPAARAVSSRPPLVIDRQMEGKMTGQHSVPVNRCLRVSTAAPGLASPAHGLYYPAAAGTVLKVKNKIRIVRVSMSVSGFQYADRPGNALCDEYHASVLAHATRVWLHAVPGVAHGFRALYALQAVAKRSSTACVSKLYAIPSTGFVGSTCVAASESNRVGITACSKRLGAVDACIMDLFGCCSQADARGLDQDIGDR